MVGSLMNYLIGKYLEEICSLLSEVLIRNVSGRTEKIYKNASIKIVGDLAKIRAENAAKSSSECYRYVYLASNCTELS
jgi:hypothetical protein